MPQTATIMRFDGNKVSEVKMIAGGHGLKLDIDIYQKKIVAIHQIYGGECNACAKRWAKVTYKWDGKNYKKIEKLVSKEKSNTSPWSVSEVLLTKNN